MNLNKKTAIIGITALTSIAVMSSFVFGRDGLLSVAKATNDPYTMVLNKDTNTGLGNSFANGTFITATNLGNEVNWEFNYGKASSNNLIELGKAAYGNPDSTKYYLANTTPITSINSLNLTFSADTTLFVLASNDGTNFYKIDVMTQSGAVNGAQGYFYFKFVNANQDTTSLTINNINISYDCVEEEYTDELSDTTSENILVKGAVSGSAISHDSTTYTNGFRSSQSLKILGTVGEENDVASNSYKFDFALSLERSLTLRQFLNTKLELYYNSENVTSVESKTYSRLAIYAGGANGTRIDGKVVLNTSNFTNGQSGWHKDTVNFANMPTNSLDLDATIVSHLYIRPVYVGGYLSIDQMRLYYSDIYPEFNPSDIIEQPEEIDDLSNKSYVAGYDSADGGLDFEERSEGSLVSRKISVANNSSCRFHFDGFLVDMTGMILSFDVKKSELPSNAYVKIQIMKMVNDTMTRFEASARNPSDPGLTVQNLTGEYTGWVRYTLDMDEATAGKTGTAKASAAEYGFIFAHCENQTVHIDNVYVDYKAAEI